MCTNKRFRFSFVREAIHGRRTTLKTKKKLYYNPKQIVCICKRKAIHTFTTFSGVCVCVLYRFVHWNCAVYLSFCLSIARPIEKHACRRRHQVKQQLLSSERKKNMKKKKNKKKPTNVHSHESTILKHSVMQYGCATTACNCWIGCFYSIFILLTIYS